MSLLAGVFSRRGRAIADSTREALVRTISRNPDDQRIVFSDGRVFLVKIDIGAYGEPGHRFDRADGVSMLTGEPLLAGATDASWQSRAEDLACINRGLTYGDLSPLRKAGGVFSVVHYDPAQPALTLLVDRLGMRPLYYYVDDEQVIFASALRILEQLDEIPKKMDLHGATEMALFRHCIGSRTPYEGISQLRAAEMVEVCPSWVTSSRYWRWNQIRPSVRPEAELLSEAYHRFTTAIARRLRHDTATFAFLSGGLDTRCIAAVLRDRDVQVHSVNLARTGTQDQVLAAWFAERAGTIHEEFIPGSDVADPAEWMPHAVDKWAEAKRQRVEPSVERPQLAWSGAGGSSVVGQPGTYRRPVVELLRAGRIEAAAEEYCRFGGYQVSSRLVRSNLRDVVYEIPKRSVMEELADLNCIDPGQSLYLLYLLSADRGGMAEIVSKIDVKRIEYHLPFLDSALVETMMEIPVDLCFGHAAYVRWLQYFPPAVTAVPWQAYPGSVPCPIPIPAGIPSQWEPDDVTARGLRNRQRKKLTETARLLLRSTSFPGDVLSRANFRIMAYAHRAGLRDYGYAIALADTYHRYLSVSEERSSAGESRAG